MHFLICCKSDQNLVIWCMTLTSISFWEFSFSTYISEFKVKHIFEYFRLTALVKNWTWYKSWFTMCSKNYFHFHTKSETRMTGKISCSSASGSLRQPAIIRGVPPHWTDKPHQELAPVDPWCHWLLLPPPHQGLLLPRTMLVSSSPFREFNNADKVLVTRQSFNDKKFQHWWVARFALMQLWMRGALIEWKRMSKIA